MPALSSWNTPTVSPRPSMSKVFWSSSGIFVEIDVDAALCEQGDAGRERGQRLQAEKVEFHETRRLDPFHVELGRRHVGLGIAIERHEFVERPVADDDARGVGRGVGVEPFERLGDFQHLL